MEAEVSSLPSSVPIQIVINIEDNNQRPNLVPKSFHGTRVSSEKLIDTNQKQSTGNKQRPHPLKLHYAKPHQVVTKILNPDNPHLSPSISSRSPVKQVPSVKPLTEINFTPGTETQFMQIGKVIAIAIAHRINPSDGPPTTADTVFGPQLVEINEQVKLIRTFQLPKSILRPIEIAEIRRYQVYKTGSRPQLQPIKSASTLAPNKNGIPLAAPVATPTVLKSASTLTINSFFGVKES